MKDKYTTLRLYITEGWSVIPIVKDWYVWIGEDIPRLGYKRSSWQTDAGDYVFLFSEEEILLVDDVMRKLKTFNNLLYMALDLKIGEGMTYKELAGEFRRSMRTVQTYVAAALDTFKTLLEKELKEHGGLDC